MIRLRNRSDFPRGFTLVELLVVIAVMSILSGMMSVALSSARQDARIKRTQVEVRTISTILQQKVNDINLAPVSLVGNTGNALNAREQNRVTMLARRDLMRMKMPQCRADLIYPPARLQYTTTNALGANVSTAAKIEHPSEWAQMRRIAGFTYHSGIQVEFSSGVSPFTGFLIDSYAAYNGSAALRTALGEIRGYVIDLNAAPWPEPQTALAGETWTRDFESAECLYLILATTEIFGQRALDQFSARSIANLDGDAVPEIVDPWGNPYEFIREPVGRNFRALPTTPLPDTSHPDGPDPSDYLRTDFRFANNDISTLPTMVDDPYKISPLVVSAGQDREFGFRRSFDRRGDFTADRMGISPRTSTAVTQLSSLAALPSPLSSTPLAGAYQYPDPYAQLRLNNTAPYLSGADNSVIRANDLTNATLASWHGDGTLPAVGLGAALLTASNKLEESYADNIASDGTE